MTVRTSVENHRNYPGSIESINAQQPASDQVLTAEELNDILITSNAHADDIDVLKSQIDSSNTVLSSISISVSTGETLSGSGVLIAGRSVVIVFSDDSEASGIAGSSGNWSIAAPELAPDGTITATVTGQDDVQRTATANYVRAAAGTGSPIQGYIITQDDIDNGYTLPSPVTDINNSVLSFVEGGSLPQVANTDYFVNGLQLTFSNDLKSLLYPGYAMNFSWT